MWATYKKVKGETEDPGRSPGQIVGGTILDNTSLLMWSESNRQAHDAMRDMTKEMMELRFSIDKLTREMQ